MSHDGEPRCAESEPLKVRLRYLEKELNDMHRELFGNGQPGALARMEGRHVKSLGEMAKKLSDIENKLGRVMIAVAMLAAAGGAGGMSVVQAILGG